jgi:hypothetical protein
LAALQNQAIALPGGLMNTTTNRAGWFAGQRPLVANIRIARGPKAAKWRLQQQRAEAPRSRVLVRSQAAADCRISFGCRDTSMETVTTYVAEFVQAGLSSSWQWFNALNREEWILVLAAACFAGFLCLRGFGSRANY